MRFYTQRHKFYCGIDLHASKMYICILDSEGRTKVHKNINTDPALLFDIIFPFLEDIVICVECMFSWYWVADFCDEHKIPFVLGHALYMRAIHGGKTKSDKIDSYKIARLLMGGNLPIAYAYPSEMRATRDLLRRRNYLVSQCALLVGHIQNTNTQYNLPKFDKKIDQKRQKLTLIVWLENTTRVKPLAFIRTKLDGLFSLCSKTRGHSTKNNSSAIDFGLKAASLAPNWDRLGESGLSRNTNFFLVT